LHPSSWRCGLAPGYGLTECGSRAGLILPPDWIDVTDQRSGETIACVAATFSARDVTDSYGFGSWVAHRCHQGKASLEMIAMAQLIIIGLCSQICGVLYR
jgi:hypothetical protein